MFHRSFLGLPLVAVALALTACSTSRSAPSPAPSIASPSAPAVEETTDASVVTEGAGLADASSAAKSGPFKDIRTASVEARAITLIDEDRIYRFEGSARTPARSVAYSGVASVTGAEIEIATDHDVRYLETSTLREKGPPCAFGEGFVRVAAAHGFVLLAKDDKATFAVMNTHTCKRTNASALAAKIKASSIGDDGVLLSTRGTRLGVLEGFCDKVAVYDVASGAKLLTDTGAKRAASAKGCDAVDLADDGKVTWVPRGVCAVGGPMTFIDSRTAIVAGAGHLAIVRGYKKVECGNGVEDGAIEEIGRVSLENAGGYVQIAHADANGAVVTSETRAFVVTLAPTKPVGKAPSRIVATEILELQPR